MKLLSVILALNVLVSSTGFSVYTHFCKASSHGVISMAEIICNEGQEENEQNCCHRSTACSGEMVKDDCCETSSEFYKEDIKGLTSAMSDHTPEPFFKLVYEIYNDVINPSYSSPQLHTTSLSPGSPSGTPMSVLQVFRC